MQAQSSKRFKNESYKQAAIRSFLNYKIKQNKKWSNSLTELPQLQSQPLESDSIQDLLSSLSAQDDLEQFGLDSSAYDHAVPLAQLPVASFPELQNESELQSLFFLVRDTALLKSKQVNFLRRATWIYPDDGCFNRASLAALILEKNNKITPAKLFVYGDLAVQSPNSADGDDVTWWYHVVVSFRVKNQIYAFDPAIDPHKPLTIQQWSARMNRNGKTALKYTVCPSSTYTPYDECPEVWGADDKNKALPFEELSRDAYQFLKSEYDRIKMLGRDPIKELGIQPPWRLEQGSLLK